METRDILSGAKSFHKIYNQVIQTAAARHHLSLMDADIILFLYNNPDYDTAKDISYFRMLAKSGVSASVESLTGLSLIHICGIAGPGPIGIFGGVAPPRPIGIFG